MSDHRWRVVSERGCRERPQVNRLMGMREEHRIFRPGSPMVSVSDVLHSMCVDGPCSAVSFPAARSANRPAAGKRGKLWWLFGGWCCSSKLGFHSPEMTVEVGDPSVLCSHAQKTAGEGHIRNPPRWAAAASPRLRYVGCDRFKVGDHGSQGSFCSLTASPRPIVETSPRGTASLPP